jgi:disulfide bond formation protein DsbB
MGRPACIRAPNCWGKTMSSTMEERSEAGVVEATAEDAMGVPGTLGAIDGLLARHGMLFALAVALVATLGSLYFSEMRHYIPCRLCWFQRIFMYPLALIIPIGLLRRDPNLRFYVLPMAGIGGLIALYHVLLQKTNLFEESAACLATVPCSGQYISWFGFVSIPVLALTAFVLILLSGSADPERSGADGALEEAPPWRSVLGTILLIGIAFGLLWMLRI